MERIIRAVLFAFLAASLSACVATGERKLAFVDTQGQDRIIEFHGEKPHIAAHLNGKILPLQHLGGHQILVQINHQPVILSAVNSRAITQLTLYEISPAGFIEQFTLEHAHLCRAYIAHNPLKVQHSLTFAIRNLDLRIRKPHFWGHWWLKDDKLVRLNKANIQRERAMLPQDEWAQFVQGSARKLASFLTYVCQS
ncbi:hypothetical protein [Spirabiliibacterium falconis]|uniref:hypothetical protein n=1 Tax=Spirabiliibacterium falconis TaxID=572023 RepID=UPI001AAC9818|nr:hypothetical protein [Spirabiliibacterium falconis]MBE2894502.1 hypothetical protein [Spirabiliibacterium falconis]